MDTSSLLTHHPEESASRSQTGLFHAASDQEYYQGMLEAKIAGLVLLGCIAFAVVFWMIVHRLPKPKRVSFNEAQQIILARSIAVYILIGEAAGAWDVWWHRAVGRDSLLELPHLFLYAGATAAIIASFYGYVKTKNTQWRWIALCITLIPLSAPFDQFWHTLYGIEDLSRPISLSWSPPHMMIAFGAILSLTALIPIIYKDTNRNMRIFFTVLIFGTIATPAQFLVMPFHPTEGWGSVLGFFGTGFFAAPLIGIPLIAKLWIHTKAAATRTMIISMIFWLIMYGKETAPDIIMLPHDRVPNWLMLFATIPAAVWLDVSTRLPLWIRPALGGALMSFILLAFTPFFVLPEFQFPLSDALIGVVSSLIVCGLLGHLLTRVDWKKLHERY